MSLLDKLFGKRAKTKKLSESENSPLSTSHKDEYSERASLDEIKEGNALEMNASKTFIDYSDDCLERKLFNCVKGGNNIEKVRNILTQPININAKVQYRYPYADIYSDQTVLMLASQEGYFDIVKELIASGADVNMQNDDDKETALNLAVQYKRFDVIKELIGSGADVNLENEYGWRVLDSVVTNDYGKEIYELLEQSGAKHSEQYNRDNESNYLDEKDENLSADNESENPILDFITAAKKGDKNVIEKKISDGEDVNIESDDGSTALIEASYEGHLDIVKFLIENGANVNSACDDGTTALNQASQEGHADIVKVLIDAGADVNMSRDDNTTALILASYNEHSDIVSMLLDAGASLDIKDSYGETALFHASRDGYMDIVKMLLAKGADINAKSRNGSSPLRAAVTNGQVDIIKILISNGADPNVINTDTMETAWAYAYNRGWTEIVEMLESAGANRW